MTRGDIVIVIQGAESPEEVPGIGQIIDGARLRFANTVSQLRAALEGAEILFGWDFRQASLRQAWAEAGELKWVHWGGVGVETVLFPEFVNSDVILTNSRGVFDHAMAEYALGLVIGFAKRFQETLDLQSKRKWQHRLTERVEGQKVLIVGVGSIGRAIARLLVKAGLEVMGVGRRARAPDPDFGKVHAVGELNHLLPGADYVVLVVPQTAETVRMFGAEQFRAMKPAARLINLARGAIVDEAALISALESGEIAGAALDCFEKEPLPPESALWSLPGVFVSPHMSGDFIGYSETVAGLFYENYRRYRARKPLLNVVDKAKGYIPGEA